MRGRFLFALMMLALAGCSQGAPQAFVPESTPSAASPAPRATLDRKALGTLRDTLLPALQAHIHDGSLDLAWGAGSPAVLAGPFSDAVPEADAAALQALRAGGPASPLATLSSAVTDAFKQLDGPRGGAYLLLADAAHPAAPGGPVAIDTPVACPTPIAGAANPECLRKQVSDGLLAAWYSRDTRMFFHVGETTTVYRPVDAIAVGAALVVAGFQLRDEVKIAAGTQVLDHELRNDLDDHYGLLYGLVTATAQGGRTVTDYNARLADQAGAAEAIMEAFDYSREAKQQGFAQKLLQPLLDEKFPARTTSGAYIPGFDVQSSGPAGEVAGDLFATVLALQAANHYDRDDGGRFAQLEETAAAGLMAAVEADRKAGADPSTGLPARLTLGGPAQRSGISTAIAVSVLSDLLRQP